MRKLMTVIMILPALSFGEELMPLRIERQIDPARKTKIQECKDEKGKITLSNVGCDEKEKAKELKVTPNILDNSGLRAYGYRNPKKPEYPIPRQAQTFRDPIECENAKRIYSFVAGYRYAKPHEFSEKQNEVFRKCGYWP